MNTIYCPNCGKPRRWWQQYTHYVYGVLPGWLCRKSA
jgi:hypothetical protein